MALLVLHFPKLRLIWSPSQRFTADAFVKLKEGRYQPDPQAAAAAGMDEDDDLAEEPGGDNAVRPRLRVPKNNSAALDVLRKLPGVTPRNMYALARRAGSLAGVAQLAEEELVAVMGKGNAQQLHAFLHKEVATHTFFGNAVEAAAMS